MAKEYVLFISSHAVQMIYGSCDKKDMIKVEAFHEYPLEEGVEIPVQKESLEHLCYAGRTYMRAFF